MRWMFFFVLSLLLTVACEKQAPVASDHTLATLSLALPKQPSSALVHIGMDKGFFEQQQIEINPVLFASGKRALLGVINDKIDADIIFASDIAVLGQIKHLPDYRIAAVIFEADNLNRLVLSGSGHTADNFDWHGKRLCTQFVSAIHFFADMVLMTNDYQGVKFVYQNINELNQSLESGYCDIISSREPFITQIKQTQQESSILAFPGTYVQYELMLVRNSVDDALTSRFIEGLINTENFLDQNPEEAIAILAKALDANIDQIRSGWKDNNISVSLPQSLLLLLDVQNAWINKVVNSFAYAGDVRDLLNLKPMRSVAPQRETVIIYD